MIKHLRNIFITGLFVLVPIFVTLSIVIWLFNRIDAVFREPLELFLGFPLVGIGVILTILIILITGFISTNLLGKKIILFTEAVFKKIPLVNTVYISMKQLTDTLFTSQKNAFKSAVLVEYPSKGIYVIGFITADAAEEINLKTQSDLKSVFIPTTPNPTSGMLVMIPEEDIQFLDLSIEAAIKLIVSGGILLPENQKKLED
ncbi:DUF502 domain-containing protein [Geosporobacter ferrireducens]|uniref:DUF502 domain-containing protein n=1 Tax=Geosporobacter ferrireducens TaxID=1424294 RepID=A0A1D8GMJ9_9FIRM|nr:DUF502 domain-containing protein [Geosporobacter ferrireducens]AOT72156.1 hypothetical protein Gferi_23005 [Geosporobacter ferrireducens]MTI56044.1 DUF502 domain-containing protein [Geosporobacter ferrireducens]